MKEPLLLLIFIFSLLLPPSYLCTYELQRGTTVNIRQLLWRDMSEVEHLFGNQVDFVISRFRVIFFDTGVSVDVNNTPYVGVPGDATGIVVK